ncbi:hypothetical protein INF35_08395 [Subdoligranulum sp. DSM 109015]|uniref:Uncharacterized protein n=1 Tax=Gemmiger gallinarum TaxID=2779354 RepID=A0ABR9R3S0_9FIRM|nr:hypothetical protein [Gemmiger gallinarum]
MEKVLLFVAGKKTVPRRKPPAAGRTENTDFIIADDGAFFHCRFYAAFPATRFML